MRAKYDVQKYQNNRFLNKTLTCWKCIVHRLVPAFRLVRLCDKCWRTQVLIVSDNVTLQIRILLTNDWVTERKKEIGKQKKWNTCNKIKTKAFQKFMSNFNLKVKNKNIREQRNKTKTIRFYIKMIVIHTFLWGGKCWMFNNSSSSSSRDINEKKNASTNLITVTNR